MSSTAFTKDLDAVLLAYGVLGRLGSGKVDTFLERLKSQKIQYLAQVFGISPAYNFNLYIRGPYSPNLAQDLFSIKSKEISPSIEKFTPDELEERFQKTKNFINGKTLRNLELISTLHWLIDTAGLSYELAVSKFTKIKGASEGEVVETKKYVEELCQLSK